jgi:tetraacyldisaccharide 4'-kinase
MGNQQKLRRILYPLSILYEIAVRIRNLFFDWNLLPSRQYPLPVICIGNLSAGGTGKTPLVEYLIRLLSPRYRVGVLSRGYKRNTSGYILAGEKSTSREIGDEACQIKHKFPQVTVAVDENRREGIQHLMALPEDVRPQVILLDDGFQHRYVQPSLSIVVTDCNRPFYSDEMLPAGRLREPAGSVKRTDIVIVSKCSKALKPIDCRIIENEMNLKPHQPSFFSRIVYEPMEGLCPESCEPLATANLQKEDEILLLTGIANPAPLIEEMKKYSDRVKSVSFADHHAFNQKDIARIRRELKKMTSARPLIVCTEKDAARIRNNPSFPDEWKPLLYYVPIRIEFLFGKGAQLDELVLRHITTIENSRILQNR